MRVKDHAISKALSVDLALTVLPVMTPAASLPTSSALSPSSADTVYVAPPTGERQTDRASILAALAQIQPGGVIQFAAGTYLVGGEITRVDVPRVTLQGNLDGTTLRGCDLDQQRPDNACNGLELASHGQIVRGLTFENLFWSLHVGCCWEGFPYMRTGDGGHVIEGNTFSSSGNAVRVHGFWSQPSVIRNNRFLNNWHSVAVYGGTAHVLDNEILAPDPEQVPGFGFPWDAIHLGPPMPLADGQTASRTWCGGNRVAGNRIEGVPDGIWIDTDAPGTRCGRNVVRDNTIVVKRVRSPSRQDADPTYVGTPISLLNYGEAFRRASLRWTGLEWTRSAQAGGGEEPAEESVLEENLIEGNRIIGAEGLGIEILHASRNRIVNNSFTGIQRRDPFPGNFLGPRPDFSIPLEWRNANGSAIWVSPGSDHNEIIGNTFEDIATHAVVLEGDNNRVELRSASAAVRDLGRGNRVTTPARAGDRSINRTAAQLVDAWPRDVPPGDTVRYTLIVDGHRKGERRMWREDPATWRYSYAEEAVEPYRFPRSERLVLDSAGLPVRVEIDGQRNVWDAWEERFEHRDGRAVWSARARSRLGPEWSRTLDEDSAGVADGVYYAAVHPAHDAGVLARILLRRDGNSIGLLPDGVAHLEQLGERAVRGANGLLQVRLYAIHGLDLRPMYVWLDDGGATFADEWSVRSGLEDVFPEPRTAIEEALAHHHERLAEGLIPPARNRPLVIRGARLFDPQTGTVRSGTTIIVEGDRIAVVGSDESVNVPPGADVVEAAGRMALPGLWDMHAHHGMSSAYLELDAPLHLAAGITTARDLGTHTQPMLSLRRRIAGDSAVGPRLVLAGFIDGDRPSGVLVRDTTDARAAVDRFAELGYVQIKIYDNVPPALVPVVIEQARRHGLRVSGHVPFFAMTVQQAVELGYNEIQHLDGSIMVPLVSSLLATLAAGPSPERLDAFYRALADLTAESAPMQELIRLMVSRDVALDPTFAVIDSWDLMPRPWLLRIADRLPFQARRRLIDDHLFSMWPLHPAWSGIRQNLAAIVRAMHEAGVPILPGTDMIPGMALHRELELYVEAGIPAPDVLTLATLRDARVMGMDDELGSIEPGKLADLILVDGDPTTNISDIRRVVTVVKDGRVYDPAAIYRALGIRPCCEQ